MSPLDPPASGSPSGGASLLTEPEGNAERAGAGGRAAGQIVGPSGSALPGGGRSRRGPTANSCAGFEEEHVRAQCVGARAARGRGGAPASTSERKMVAARRRRRRRPLHAARAPSARRARPRETPSKSSRISLRTTTICGGAPIAANGCSSSKPGDFDSPAAPSSRGAGGAGGEAEVSSRRASSAARNPSTRQRRAGVSAEATKAQQGAYVEGGAEDRRVEGADRRRHRGERAFAG